MLGLAGQETEPSVRAEAVSKDDWLTQCLVWKSIGHMGVVRLGGEVVKEATFLIQTQLPFPGMF